jgi:hypothetical protein
MTDKEKVLFCKAISQRVLKSKGFCAGTKTFDLLDLLSQDNIIQVKM